MSNHLMREVKGEYWLNKGSSFFADKHFDRKRDRWNHGRGIERKKCA
jgi:hypothetical protein